MSKGVFAWTTVYGNVIVGPTAVDQESLTDRSTDTDTIESLKKFGEKILPVLKKAEVVGTYSGLRPSTQYRDYQIRSHPHQQWITVGGIRSTGLSGSSGIAEYVGDLLEEMEGGEKKRVEMRGVTEAANNPDPLEHDRNIKHNGPVPTLKQLAENYRHRGDGTVEIYGRVWHVTHPISSFGMETYPLPEP